MKEMMVMLAQIIPEEDLLEQLLEKIKEYQVNPNKSTKNILGIYCALLNTKFMVAEKGEGFEAFMKTISELNELEEAQKLFKTMKG